MTPAVVVLAYERPESLRRLLTSLERAAYPSGDPVTLLISVDRSDSAEHLRTKEVAEAFAWRHGPKDVLVQQEHLGVVRHFKAAGALTRQYGDVVLLEDDLTVSPAYFSSALQLLKGYRHEPRIAGFCLYGLWFNGFTLEPFQPVQDGADVFFLGTPYTQGLCFTAEQWSTFEAWSEAGGRVEQHSSLHPAFLRFGKDEWFPSLASYLAQTDRFFCFPRASLTTGWGDAGAHFDSPSSWFQTSLLMEQTDLRLPALDDAIAVYDGFFELLPDRLKRLAPALTDMEFDIDLNATKRPENLRTDYVLTTRPVRDPRLQFGLEAYPVEANVAMAVPGNAIALARRDDVRWDDWAETEARRRLHEHAWRHHRPSLRRSLRFAGAQFMERWRQARGAEPGS